MGPAFPIALSAISNSAPRGARAKRRISGIRHKPNQLEIASLRMTYLGSDEKTKFVTTINDVFKKMSAAEEVCSQSLPRH